MPVIYKWNINPALKNATMISKNILLVLILLVSFSCRKKSSSDYEFFKSDVKDSLVVADTIQQSKLIDTTVVFVTDTVPTPEVKKGVDLNDNYFLVVASYTIEEYAIAKMNELIGDGYQPQVFMINEDGWYKLAVASYATYKEAKTALGILREKGGLFGNAVIVSRKSKS